MGFVILYAARKAGAFYSSDIVLISFLEKINNKIGRPIPNVQLQV
jgi:hypothetical protein